MEELHIFYNYILYIFIKNKKQKTQQLGSGGSHL
jgi:hypothetical protein